LVNHLPYSRDTDAFCLTPVKLVKLTKGIVL
jgi:hypothetical protein